MSRIRILSEQVANQIAAGEVVERPASVIKELVENSVDAGATRIDVHVEGGGTGLLRVADDGEGMDGDDVLLCLERHATSKLRDESQLAAIATLGFRGEAIPSIASVSRMTILSRQQGQALGTRAEIRYGTLQAVHQDGGARGTVIEVRQLFGNMPARKKFLKSVRTELYHIEEVVKNQALAHPAIGFTLMVDGRVALEYQAKADLETRVRAVFRYKKALITLEDTGVSENELTADGYLLLPETTPAGQARLRILVNDRPIQDAMIRHAVSEGMQGYLMRGYQPGGVLRLRVPPEQVDVNVHPAKREIRFRQGEMVHRSLAARVTKAMEQYQQTLRDDLFTGARPHKRPASPPFDLTAARFTPQPVFATAEPLAAANPAGTQAAQPVPAILSSDTKAGAQVMPSAETLPAAAAASPDEDFAGLSLIGQLFALYLLAEKDGQLVVIDQHAAHERLLYGQLRQGYLDKVIPRQQLLFPAMVELTPMQCETLETQAEAVAALGLEATLFGGNTALVKSVPAALSPLDPALLLPEMLDGLRGMDWAGARHVIPPAVDELLASMACKAAIKAGDRLQPAEMLKLLAQMQASPVFSHCPHGRPVLKTFSLQEVERWFHRHGA